MSIQAHALSLCAAGALIEQLPSWFTVELEPHEPLDRAAALKPPLVAVFIGDERAEIQARKWTLAQPTIELVVQAILPVSIRATLNDATCEFDPRQGGTRTFYAIVHEALRRAFMAPALGSWGALLQAIVVQHPGEVTGMPGKAAKGDKPGVPLIDYSVPCKLIQSPAIGVPAGYPWADIADKMRADDAFLPEEAEFFAAMLAGVPLSDPRIELASVGLSLAEGAALGLGPVEAPGLNPDGTLGSVEPVDPFSTLSSVEVVSLAGDASYPSQDQP